MWRWAEWTEIRYKQNFRAKFFGLMHEIEVIENQKWGLIACDTNRNPRIDIVNHCLTAAGCPSALGAHKIGHQAFPGLNLVLQATPFAERKGLVTQPSSCCHGRNLM